jgi:SET domain-containing protein
MRLWDKARQLFKKPSIQQAKAIEIKKSPLHGQGVFAKKEFRPGKIIEISPVVLLSQQEKELLRHTLLFGYYFVVDHPEYAIAMGLGASSTFNHSYVANAEYTIAIEDQAITIRAGKVIRKGEEITLNYNGHPDGNTPVYFPAESTEFAEYPAFPDRDKYKKQLYLKIMPGKGRGVFCKKHIKAGSLIETSPLLVLPAQDYPAISHTQLTDYIFQFDKERRLTALALGFGSLYNHALYPNATYEIDHANRLIRYYASENISDGKEICINYDGSPGSEEWFKARKISHS